MKGLVERRNGTVRMDGRAGRGEMDGLVEGRDGRAGKGEMEGLLEGKDERVRKG